MVESVKQNNFSDFLYYSLSLALIRVYLLVVFIKYYNFVDVMKLIIGYVNMVMLISIGFLWIF